jgi:hypothetical protein
MPAVADVGVIAPLAFDGIPTHDQALDAICRAIEDAGTMCKGNEIAVDLLARAIVDYHQSRVAVREFKDAHPAADMDGKAAYTYSVLNSAFRTAENALWKNIREFGLTPASIAEVSRPEPKKVANEGPQKAPLKRGA